MTTIIHDINPELFDHIANIWQLTGVGRPERGDTYDLVLKTLDHGGRIIILMEGEKPVGTAWITNDARRLYLHHMAVLPEMQGKGYGQIVMQDAIRYADEMKMQMKLEVHKDNAPARHIYQKYGFKTDLAAYRVMIRR